MVMAVVGVCGFGWMGAILTDRIVLLAADGGWWTVLLDGRVQHGVGELLASVPFFSILVASKVRAPHQVRALSASLAPVMILGGLLNGLAWYSTGAEPWNSVLRLWCLCLLVFGFVGSWTADWLVTKEWQRVHATPNGSAPTAP